MYLNKSYSKFDVLLLEAGNIGHILYLSALAITKFTICNLASYWWGPKQSYVM